jgi:hypothetical protein
LTSQRSVSLRSSPSSPHTFRYTALAVLFPGTHNAIMVMAVVMEAAKVVTAA